VIGEGLGKKKGQTVGIYGWFTPEGRVIQGEGVNWSSHEWTYADYSHGIRLVHKDMQIDGVILPIREALKDEEFSVLVSDEGVFTSSSYLEHHADYLQGQS
jgi:hypothetical protein